MEFNLKSYLRKQASTDNLNQTTEGQLKNDGKSPSSLQEDQLDKSRTGEPTAISEKQLDVSRAKKVSQESTTEAQLNDSKKTRKDAPGRTTEQQLSKNQVGGSTAPVEKRLDGVREATFNLKEFLSKRASKGQSSNQVTEGQLGERGKREPKNLTDAQLERGRKDTKPVTIQALLEKSRTGEADRLVEARLDSSDSKLMKHRNASASAGDIPKLEEQRIKASKAVEGEKYKPASETDKDFMLPEVEGKDGIKTASAGFWKAKFAQAMPSPLPEAELSIDDGSGESPEEDLEEPLVFEESSQNIKVGDTVMKQIVIRFEPSQLFCEPSALEAITKFLIRTHPSLSSVDLANSVTMTFDTGTAFVMLPAELFAE